MEDSKQTSDDKNSIESSSEKEKESTKEENVEAFTEFLEKASYQESNEGNFNSDRKIKKQEIKSNSLFKRFLNNGFDGISSNPNLKMLALLIILLINLSLFFCHWKCR